MSARTDRETVARLFETYYDSLSKIAFCYLKNIYDAQDIACDVFLKYIEAHPRFESSEHEKAWFIRVTINKCKDFSRHSKYIRAEAICRISATDSGSEILDLVMALPEKYRAVIHMFYYEDMSARQIADVLKISVSAVTKRLERARKMLEPHLKD